MFFVSRKALQLQLYVCLILITRVNFSRGADNNSSDIQSLLDEFTASGNGTDLFHADLDRIFDTSIDNDSSNELVIKKNLYIFPINAPNLVISQKHEIHAIPVENATNSTDDEPVTELQDVHEISLSKLLPVNGSQTPNITNETYFGNDSILNTSQNFEIVSGYEPGSGLVTKEIPLPETVSNSIILPAKSIDDLLSSLNETAQESEPHTSDLTKRGSQSLQLERNDFMPMLSRAAVENSAKEELDDEEDMDVAADIVFRPLFRYRQETRLRPQYVDSDDDTYRRSDARRRNRNKYNNNNYNYDNYYYSRYRYRPQYQPRDYNK